MCATNDQRFSELQEEIKQLQTELKAAKEAQRHTLQNSTHFLAHLSHEIRTPLNIILGFTDLLTAEIETPQQRERLEAISSNSRHLLDLINKVLHFAKLDASINTPEEKVLDLYFLTAEIKSMFQESLSERGVALKIQADPAELPQYILTDPDRLKEALVNLIGNAAKFTKEGSVTLTIQPDSTAQFLSFRVSDTGCGIPKEELPHIFRPFSQASNQENHMQTGTGLGLAIVKKNVTLLGGNLDVVSREGYGTEFFFTMPCKPTESTSEVSPAITPDALSSASRQKRHTVLVVDDHQANRELLYQVLEPYPFQVREASNGAEALDVIQDNLPDLVLLDLAMPILDGEATIKALRAQKNTQALPILVLSAMAFEENRQSAMRAGADGFIAKPFKKEHLLQSLFDLLDIPYAPQQRNTASPQTSTIETKLRFPEAAWLQEFRAVLQELDPLTIESKLEEVQSSHPVFFKKASHWIDTFAFGELEAWLNQHALV